MKTVVSRFLPYVKLFSPFGIPLRVHYTSWLFISGMAWYLQKPDILFPGDFGMSLLFMVCFMVCQYLGVLGFALLVRGLGFRPREFKAAVWSIGVEFEEAKTPPRQGILLSVAAAVAMFVMPGLLFAGHCLALGVPEEDWERGFFFYLMICNFVFGLLNLVPCTSTAGHLFLYSLLALKLSKNRSLQITTSIGLIISLGCMAWALLRPFFGYELVLFLSGLWLSFLAILTLLATLYGEDEDEEEDEEKGARRRIEEAEERLEEIKEELRELEREHKEASMELKVLQKEREILK